MIYLSISIVAYCLAFQKQVKAECLCLGPGVQSSPVFGANSCICANTLQTPNVHLLLESQWVNLHSQTPGSVGNFPGLSLIDFSISNHFYIFFFFFILDKKKKTCYVLNGEKKKFLYDLC